MNSKNSRTSDLYVVLSNLSVYYTWKNIERSQKNNNFKVSVSTWNEEFKLHNDHPPHQKFKIILNIYIYIYIKKNREKTDILSIRMYINKVENRTTLKIK